MDVSDFLLMQGEVERIPLPTASADLVIGSPPYAGDVREYGLPGSRRPWKTARQWVDWMTVLTDEALRVSKGLVCWVCAGPTKDNNYWPAPEGLAWEWFLRGGECHQWRPAIWWKVDHETEGGCGTPGSGAKQGLRCDTEYVLMFRRPGDLPWADSTAMGGPPKCPPGGAFSHRNPKGERAGIPHTKRRPNGSMRHDVYVPPERTNAGNVIKARVGGGHLGHGAAHLGEAPFPVRVAEFFVRSYCPPGGIVLDPFMGSGTTAEAALKFGRRAIGLDLRRSQAELATRRLTQPHAPIRKHDPTAERPGDLKGQRTIFEYLDSSP